MRLPEVKRTTGLSRSTIYLRIAQGNFPKPVNLGGRAVGWLDIEIREWLQLRIDANRTPALVHGEILRCAIPAAHKQSKQHEK